MDYKNLLGVASSQGLRRKELLSLYNQEQQESQEACKAEKEILSKLRWLTCLSEKMMCTDHLFFKNGATENKENES